MQSLTVLGATGSIGVSTLDVAARHPDKFTVIALSGFSNVKLLAEQCRVHRPRCVVVGSDTAAKQLRDLLGAGAAPLLEIAVGEQALVDIASLPETDVVMAAIVGAAGMPAALAAARAGKKLLLANKEALVLGGKLFMQAVADGGGVLLPIDSEHNAIFQCLPHGAVAGQRQPGVSKLLLTASGGPFRQRALSSFEDITVAEAVAHPNWSMGQKISVDSATMMNKGLELIEARWLFDMPASDIQVVIHPESVIHSLVQTVDGSVLAQLGNPDMRTPIAHALGCCEIEPGRIAAGVEPLDLFAVASLHFEQPDMTRFPCLRLAYDALAAGDLAPAALNAANEQSVAAFLSGALRFTDIAKVNESTMNEVQKQCADDSLSWGQLQEVDRLARASADGLIRGLQAA